MDRRNENLSSCGCGCGGDAGRHENTRATGYAAAAETNDRNDRNTRSRENRQEDGFTQGEIKQSCNVAKDEIYGEKQSRKSEWNLYRDIDDLADL